MKLALALLALTACGTTTTTTTIQCGLTVAIAPTEAAPGDAVVATGGPMSRTTTGRDPVYDTSVRFGDVDATVTDVTRTDCTLCDACREAVPCSACDTCTECATTCESCVQSATFLVPDLPVGPATFVMTNSFGSTDPVALSVIAAPVDSGDTGGTR